MTGNMDGVLTLGKTEGSTSVNGRMESSMEKGLIDRQLVRRREDFGKREREQDGWNETTELYDKIKLLTIIFRL